MFALNDIQEQIRESARRFLGDEGAARRSPREIWSAIAELGWIGAILTEAQGGFGGPTEAVLLSREAGQSGVPLSFLSAGVLPIAFLGRLGAAGIGGTSLDEIVAGGRVVVGAWQDDGQRDEEAARGTRLERAAGGWLLRGRLDHVWGAEAADILLFPAGAAIVAIDATEARAVATSRETIDGRSILALDFSASPVKPIEIFDNAAAIEAWQYATQMTLLAQCAEMIGGMTHMFELTRDYLLVRKQFGQPLAGFQALRHRLADMFAELDQAEAMLDAGIAALALENAAARARVIAACRLRVGVAARFIGAQAIQLHGGIALTEEYALGAYYRRVMVLRKMWGDEDFHAARMGPAAEPPAPVISAAARSEVAA